MVGCVIVHQDRIIGEGWHRAYGGPHAEVRAIEDVSNRQNDSYLSESTAYVTLEPCSHFGKTPPCADLLIRSRIRRVVVANLDPNPLVAGTGIARLRDAGVEVEVGVLQLEGQQLNKRFFTAMHHHRPYIVLKWAETADGFIGTSDGSRVAISGELSNQMVHRWRSEEDAILVGYRTALLDNPRLNVRHWQGHQPVRVGLDRDLSLPRGHFLFDSTQPTLWVNGQQDSDMPSWPERYRGTTAPPTPIKVEMDENWVRSLMEVLYTRKIHSVFVEGGAITIEAFLKAGLWDEIRCCQSPKVLGHGVLAPTKAGRWVSSEKKENDLWSYYTPLDTP